MDGIFISYRREDSAGYAGRLYDRLVAHFGSERVFMDVEGIDPGTDFVEAIERAVGSCKVLIVLIGKEWSTITDEQGSRRLDDPHDFIRLETGTALKRDIRVVPVLVEGALMPRAEELPEELVALTRRQAIEISHKQWEASTGNLVEALDRIYQPQEERDGSGSEQPEENDHPGRSYVRLLLGVILVGALVEAGWLASQWLLPREPQIVGPDAPGTRVAEEPQDLVESGRVAATQPAPPAVVPSEPGNGAARDEETVDEPVAGSGEELVLTAADPQPGKAAQSTDAPVPSQLMVPETVAEDVTPEPSSEEDTGKEREAVEEVLEETQPPPEPEPESRLEPEPKKTPEIKSPPPAPKPQPRPRILEFSAGVSGDRVELCYRVADAQRLILSPRPGPLENRDADCVELVLSEATRFRLQASRGDQRVEKSLLATPEPPPEPPVQGPLPGAGDYWTYRITGRWASSGKRTVRVSAVAVDTTAVDEVQMQVEGENQQTIGQRRVTGPVARVVHSRALGTEFSPYLVAYGGLDGGASWDAIPTPDSNNFWRDWFSKGGVDGEERVNVPAGSFNATLVEINSARNPSGSPAERETEPVRVSYRIWYAPEVKRYVKMVRDTRAASGQVMDTDTFELLDYRQQ